MTAVNLNEGLVTINGSAFWGSGLPTITIPSTVVTIGGGAFDYCNDLKEIIFLSTPTTVELNKTRVGSLVAPAFQNCSSIKKVYIGRPLKYSLANDFQLFKSTLRNVTIGKYGNFKGDYSVENLTLEDGESVYNSYTGNKLLQNTDTLYMGRTIVIKDPKELEGHFTYYLKKATIGGMVTEIADNLFRNCTRLEDLTIKEGLSKIGNYSFLNCKKIKKLIIPNSVTEIGKFAFNGCDSLESITIGNSVANIGEYAFIFNDTSNTKEIISLNPTPPTIQSTTFTSSTNNTVPLYVPHGCVQLYKEDTYWGLFKNIQEIEIPLEKIELATESIDMVIGQSTTIIPTYYPTDATYKACNRTSSNEGIAKVDNEGNVTAVGAGETTITITSSYYPEISVICKVKVKPIYVESVSIVGDNHDLFVGETLSLSAIVTPENATFPTITWASSNKDIATVDNGTITAISEGSTVIIAATTDGSGIIDNYSINVKKESTVNDISAENECLYSEYYTLTGDVVNPHNYSGFVIIKHYYKNGSSGIEKKVINNND